jgi:plasmid stability protein
MADVTIHDIDPQVLERIEATAKANGRSLEDELRSVIEQIPPARTIEETRRISAKWQEYFRGRFFSDSTDDIREDRER